MQREESTQYALMQEGKTYHFDEYLYEAQHECSKLLTKINASAYDANSREQGFKKLFAEYGEGNVIKDMFLCNFGFNISIGNNCYINHRVTILDSYKVKIGNNVFIAPGVVISAVTHPLEAEKRRELIIEQITIEDDVWIGANAVILPGVTLGKGCVVGANAVVKKDVPPYTVVGGVPAKFIKKIQVGERTNG